MKWISKKWTLLIIVSFVGKLAFSQTSEVVRVYELNKAKQAVAVSNNAFFVVNNSSISKHKKSNGAQLTMWQDSDSVIHHLNSARIINGKLYCCNSNYPESPMASSIEIFDTATLAHIGNHSLGILKGSATWIDWRNGFWYVAFAHYTGRGSQGEQDNSWACLVKFTANWTECASWIFPKPLIERFDSRSNSGGFFINDSTLYCTGHDLHEIYKLRLPNKGYTLEWLETISVGSYGQGIDMESINGEDYLYGIIKSKSQVVVSKIN